MARASIKINAQSISHLSPASSSFNTKRKTAHSRQDGFSSLLLTSALLMAALVMSLGLYRGIFFQVKQVQNQVQDRKAHWQAEGALECAYAYIQQGGEVNWQQEAGRCGLGPDVTASVTAADGHKQVSGFAGSVAIHKAVAQGNSRIPSGAIQTTAKLLLPWSTNFYTSDPGNRVGDRWECATVRHKTNQPVQVDRHGVGTDMLWANNFINGGISAKVYISRDFSREEECDGHIVKGAATNPKGLVAQDNVTPFENLFGVPVADFKKVKQKKVAGSDGKQVDLFATITNCNSKVAGENVIAHQLGVQRKTHLWVDDDCVLSGNEYKQIAAASRTHKDGVTLIFHGKSLTVNAFVNDPVTGVDPENPANAHRGNEFRGVIFYFDHGKGSVDPAVKFNGSIDRGFQLTGALFIDAEDKQASMSGALTFIYNRDVLNFTRRAFSSTQWLEGSWRDF